MRRALALAVAATLLLAVAHQGNPNFRSSGTTPPPARASSDGGGASKGLGVTALILGALGLVAGLAAFAARRRGVRTS